MDQNLHSPLSLACTLGPEDGRSRLLRWQRLHEAAGVVGVGVKTAAYAYDPYGATRTAGGTASATNPFRYTGGHLNSQAAYTSSGSATTTRIGRFTQPDLTAEHNQYIYVRNNFCNGIDRTGGACTRARLSLAASGFTFVSGTAAPFAAVVGTGGATGYLAYSSYAIGVATLPLALADVKDAC